MPVDWHAKAMDALRILVQHAQQGNTTTYGELGESIGVHHRHVSRALQIIRDDICQGGERAPMINVLVLRKGDANPGPEVLGPWGDHLSDNGRQRTAASEQERVFEYDGWDDLLAELGLKPIE